MSEQRFGFRKLLPLMIPAVLILPIVFALGTAVRANPDLYVDIDNECGGKAVCYTTIQAAVNVAGDGDTIYVFPGTYDESVNLSAMDPDGNIALVTVDDNGKPTVGTVTVSSSISGPHSEFYTYDPLDGDIAIEGFNVHSAAPGIDVEARADGHNHNVVIRHVTATNIDQHGIEVTADGNVTIDRCTASHNGGTGILANAEGNVTISHCKASDNAATGISVSDTDGDVEISDCTANSNRGTPGTDAGISVVNLGGALTVSDCDAGYNATYGIWAWTVGGTVTLSNCTANDNDSDGVRVQDAVGTISMSNVTANGNGTVGFAVIAEGDLTFEHCTARGNDGYGYSTVGVSGTLTLDSSVAQASDYGASFYHIGTAGPVLANGNIICGNTTDGLEVSVGSGPTADAEGNWWGCTGGPGSLGCDTVAAWGGGVVDHDPWIDTITATVGPVMLGIPSVINFQFYGGDDPDWVYLGEGPGDLHGTPPFTVTTTNGTLTDSDETGSAVHEFVLGGSGVLSVTLVPASNGAATVTLDGPCGLDMLLPLEVETYWVYVPLVMRNY